MVLAARAYARSEAFAEQDREAYESRVRFDRGQVRPLPPDQLYLGPDELAQLLDEHRVIRFTEGEEEGASEIPAFALAP